jgi:hypothetical protein
MAKGKTGKRYTPAQKRMILKYIENHGRGGLAAAHREFGISLTALAHWMKPWKTSAKRGKVSKRRGRPPQPAKVRRNRIAIKVALKAFAKFSRQFDKVGKLVNSL